MTKEVSLEHFLAHAEQLTEDAANGIHIKIRSGCGLNTVLIDEVEWTMLCQALAICAEHPEWTCSNKYSS